MPLLYYEFVDGCDGHDDFGGVDDGGSCPLSVLRCSAVESA